MAEAQVPPEDVVQSVCHAAVVTVRGGDRAVAAAGAGEHA